ncbi:uncharacterized protein At3g49140-like isoform X1 [Coffea arabica]|uniref:Uncharacterized protein At3g49140-like isoform X1 n=1 Tax=Coffea arabica TaxID=13443 RepID=A0ABM4X369_COFAR|nr:uncharacterized protein At3g49140 isoform X1 [Coffea arabica]
MWIATAAAAAAASSSISLGPSSCHYCPSEGICCSTSYGITGSWTKSVAGIHRISAHSGLSFRCDNSFFGVTLWLPNGHENCNSRVSVAADYSDSLPDSSSYGGDNGYHPLEELRECRRTRVTKLTDAEIARSTVEANNRALLFFPSMVHCEPHEQVSWDDFPYVIDEYGDIFVEIYDKDNILQDPQASNPVNALIGMDISQYENRRIDTSEYGFLENNYGDDITYLNDYAEFEDSEMLGVRVDWGMPDSSSWVHPIYFAKCLTKVVSAEHVKMIDHPSNGVSVWGHLKPAYVDEELYLRRLFDDENNDGYTSGWTDGEGFSSSDCGSHKRSTIYRLDIMKMDLFSVYGEQLAISLEDFQDAEPDILVHSTAALVERFDEPGVRCNFALKALCKKKGLLVEGANLIGVDSLGMDVRVFSGSEVLTHRFPFKVRATSEAAADKQIQQLLFPRSRRKKRRTLEKLRDTDSF